MRIAIVGSGVSGLVAAHHLHPSHEITVFEADDRLGGHTNTVDLDLPDGQVRVDTGFIVCNERTYPNFLALLDELGVATQPSEMSFAVTDARTGLEYRASNPSTLYAQPRNIVRPAFQRMLVDILRFNRAMRHLAHGGSGNPDESLAEFVRRGRYSRTFTEQFLVPFGASIWSADPRTFLEFPVSTYARFVTNHGMTDLRNRPQWFTVVGGSSRYVDALVSPFRDRIRANTPVRRITRPDDGASVEVHTDHGASSFDRVVLATHSDQALRLLDQPTVAEQEILGAIRYQPNVATLHSDERFLPRNPKARASWNFHLGVGDGGRATLTYWMNRLQSLPTPTPLLVTLNQAEEIDPGKVHRSFDYHHPVFDGPAIAAQRRRNEIQGRHGTYFAGAYWGYGFHEDGVKSGLDVVEAVERP